MPLQRLLRIEWDVVAGIIAAVIAMLFSFMGVATEPVVRGIILLLLALLLIRDLRGEGRTNRLFDHVDYLRRQVVSLHEAVNGPDLKLIGPKKLRQEFVQFTDAIYGEVTWFNFCGRMFRRQEIFDAVLRPMFENPKITAIRILCSPEEHRSWEADVLPKLQTCAGRKKLHGPFWGPIHGDTSFILGDVGGDGHNEALVAILAEPFSAPNIGPTVPRYALRLFSHCELMGQVEELMRHAITSFRSDVEEAEETAVAVPIPPDTRGGHGRPGSG